MTTAARPADQYLHGIDGLRAIAVLAVMIYHLDFSLLPGGFTGVDVFFVISGYVITKSLSRKSTLGFADYIWDFYKRRILRILPALLLCLVITSLLSALFIPSSWLSSTNTKTGVAAFFGMSNIILIIFSDGYFSPKAEFNPFLHTWSLAVEEQFYLLFPILFFAWMKFRTHNSVLGFLSHRLLMMLAIASLIFAYYETAAHHDRAYYLLPSRFWELAAGALLFKFHLSRAWEKCSALPASFWLIPGFAITTAGFVLSVREEFPFPWAIVPVVGSVLMINGIASQRTAPSMLHRLLESAPLTFIGLISYSLYLWHWPIYTLLRWTSGMQTGVEQALAILFTFALAILSYRYVETPVRQSHALRGSGNRAVVAGGIAISAFLAVISGALMLNKSYISPSITADQYNWYPYEHQSTVSGGNSGEKEFTGRKLFVVGDSHTLSYTTMLAELRHSLGIEYQQFYKTGCHIFGLRHPYNKAGYCTEFKKDTLQQIESASRPGDIVFFASLRVDRLSHQLLIKKSTPTQQNTEADSQDRDIAIKEANAIVERLSQSGLKILIDLPKPVFRAPAFRCSDWFNRSNPVCAAGFTVSRAFLLKRQQATTDSIRALQAQYPSVSVWDPFPVLCPSDPCNVFDDDQPLFFDGDHLTGHGNRVLTPSFQKVLHTIWSAAETPSPARPAQLSAEHIQRH